MGVDWYIDSDGVGKPAKVGKKKPILLLFPGLGGGSNNMYTHGLAKAAQLRGFKCGTVLYRCAPSVPVTSCRLTASCCWDDVRHVVDYVN